MNSGFLYWSEFEFLIPEISWDYFLKLSKRGQAPTAHRLTPRGTPRFDREAVVRWLTERGRWFDRLEETFDGEPRSD